MSGIGIGHLSDEAKGKWQAAAVLGGKIYAIPYNAMLGISMSVVLTAVIPVEDCRFEAMHPGGGPGDSISHGHRCDGPGVWDWKVGLRCSNRCLPPSACDAGS